MPPVRREDDEVITTIRLPSRLRSLLWGLGGTLAAGFVTWGATQLYAEGAFLSSLGWRVPRVERKVQALEEAQAAQKELDRARHEEIMTLLNRLLAGQRKREEK